MSNLGELINYVLNSGFAKIILLPITVGIISSIVRAAGWTKETKPPSTSSTTNDNNTTTTEPSSSSSSSTYPPPPTLSSPVPVLGSPTLTSSTTTTTGRRIRTEENKYERRSSRLDLHGDLVRPFRAPETNTYTQNRRGSTFGLVSPTVTPVPSTVPPTTSTPTTTTVPLGITLGNDMIGWYNLMIVVLFTYVVSNAIHACSVAMERMHTSASFLAYLYACFDISTWFLDRGATATHLFIHTPALLRDILIMFIFYTTLTYGIQACIKHHYLRSRWLIVTLQTMAELALFFGPCIYARTSACASWPVTQRLAFLMEAAVLSMKMHSYFTVNRHLAKEISLGGPGTGEKVLEAAAIEAKREQDAQLQRDRTIPYFPSSPAPTTPSSPEISLPIGPSQRNVFASVSSFFQALNTHIRKESKIEALEAAANIGRASGTSIGITNVVPSSSSTTAPLPSSTTKSHTVPPSGSTVPPEEPSSPGGLNNRTPGESTAENASTINLASPSSHRTINTLTASVPSIVPSSTATEGLRRNESSSHLRALAWIKQAAETTTGSIQSLIHGKTDEGRNTTLTQIRYPHNVTLKDFLNYSVAPTLCYEPNYPRTEMIELAYIVEKIFLATGLTFAGIYVFSNYMNPVLHRITELTIIDALAQLVLPTIAVTLIIFFVIFECILNACAEITYFADRNYYHDWWNSTSFAEFSRKWNTPVHEFLLRHIFLDTMLRRGASSTTALYLTYIISILLHEFIIWGVLGIVTPYLGILSTVQFPLITLLRLPIFRGRRLGNLFFWSGLIIGVTLILVMYAKEYYQLQQNPSPPLTWESISDTFQNTGTETVKWINRTKVTTELMIDTLANWIATKYEL